MSPAFDAPCRVLAVAADPAARLAYARELAAHGAQCLFADSPTELFRVLEKEPVSGILLDLGCLIRDKCHDKAALAQVGEFYPVVKARIDPAADRVLAVYAASPDPDQGLAAFVRACRLHEPRTLRVNRRHTLTLHGHLRAARPDAGDQGPAVRTWTANFSLLGCFVCLQAPEAFAPGSRVELSLLGLPDLPSLPARVVWVSAFGPDGASPGLGLRFENLDHDLRLAVAGLCGLAPPCPHS